MTAERSRAALPPPGGRAPLAAAPPVTGPRDPQPRRRSRWRWAWVPAVAAGAGYLYLVDPHQGGYPVCPTYALTGTYCPGCGGLRAAHALLHGDLALSLQRNPMVLVLLIWAAVWVPLWLRRGRPPITVDTSSWRFWSLLALVVVYWVARNLPGMEWLSPV